MINSSRKFGRACLRHLTGFYEGRKKTQDRPFSKFTLSSQGADDDYGAIIIADARDVLTSFLTIQQTPQKIS